MLGGDTGHQGLGPVTAGHAEQVGAVGHRLLGHRGHVHRARALKQGDLGSESFRLLLQPEPGDLPAARPRVHDQERVPRARRRGGRHGRAADGRGQRRPSCRDREQHQRDRHHGDPQQARQRESNTDEQRRGDDQQQREPADQAAVGQEPERARQHRGYADRGAGHQRETAPPGLGEQERRGGEHQGERGAGEPAPGRHAH